MSAVSGVDGRVLALARLASGKGLAEQPVANLSAADAVGSSLTGIRASSKPVLAAGSMLTSSGGGDARADEGVSGSSSGFPPTILLDAM